MKTNSLNIKRSGRKGNLLATLLVVTASLLFSASAWARTFTEGEIIYVNTKYHSWFNGDNYYPALSTSSEDTSDNDFAAATSFSSDKLYALEVTTTTEITDYLYIHRVNGSKRYNMFKFAVGEGNEIVLLSEHNDNQEWYGDWRTYSANPESDVVYVYSSTQPHVYAFTKYGEKAMIGSDPGTLATLDDDNAYSWYSVALPAEYHDIQYKVRFSTNSGYPYPSSGGLGSFTGDAITWYYKNNSEGGTKDISKYQFYFSDETTLTPTAFIAENPKYGFYATAVLAAGTYKFGWKYNGTAKTGDNLKFSNTRGNVTTLEKVDSNTYLQLTLSTSSSVTFYIDPGSEQVFVDAAFAPTTVPTVFNAKAPVTEAGSYEATLSGYLKYTGCETILENGFIYSTDIDDMKTDTPTGDKTYNTLSVKMEAASLFDKTETFANGTYYYRSYIKYNDGTSDYYAYSPKSDIGSFTVNGECSSESTITVSINKESAVLSSTAAEATLTATANKALYEWECITKPSSDVTVTFTSGESKTTDVNVSAAGDYVFQLKGRCSDGEAWKTSTNTVSLHVCVAPTVQQLYLDEAVSNIICSGEKSTATIISQTGYDYTLRSESKTFGTLKGSGATLTWRNVDGTGTFTVIASETGTGQCESQMTAATQTLSAAKLVIDASSLTVNAYQPVTLSVDTEESNIDSNPVWQITAGQAGYMLEPDTRMQYDGEHERASVVFKGGATAQTTYSVKATADYTTVLTTGNKVCEATATVNIEVSPATESCGN